MKHQVSSNGEDPNRSALIMAAGTILAALITVAPSLLGRLL